MWYSDLLRFGEFGGRTSVGARFSALLMNAGTDVYPPSSTNDVGLFSRVKAAGAYACH
jgi:hypothetical protein